MRTTQPSAARAPGANPKIAGDRLLVAASALFTAAVLVHGYDHLRRGADAISRDVFWAGTAAIVVEVGVVVLATQRHRLAPIAAVAAGFGLAFGYVLVHFLPARAWLSDALGNGAKVNALSWFAASAEVLTAALLGVVGAIALRERGGLASASRLYPEQRALADALRHPVTVTMLVGNAVILGVSLVQI